MKFLTKKNLSFFISHLSFKKGFTLIELLIVIAILGVLAAAVLVAINPAERLAEAKDSQRITAIGQLGNAMQVYATIHGGLYPAPISGWQTNLLVSSGEIKNAISVQPASVISCPGPSGGYKEGDICYSTPDAVDDTDGAIWTYAESNSMNLKAGGGYTCPLQPGNPNYDPTGNSYAGPAIIVWIGSKGKVGVTCERYTGGGPLGDHDTYYTALY